MKTMTCEEYLNFLCSKNYFGEVILGNPNDKEELFDILLTEANSDDIDLIDRHDWDYESGFEVLY